MSTIALRQLPSADQQEPPERAIGDLMRRYCDAIQGCESIPRISLLPGVTLYLRILLWYLSFWFSFFTLFLDMPILLIRSIFGRPRFLVGQKLYSNLASPFKSVWGGEISAFKLISARYLSKMFLYYHAQFRMNRLQNAYNRRYLDMLISKPANSNVLAETDEFQKSFDLFQSIIKRTSQLNILTVGGPLAALLFFIVDKAVIPLTMQVFSWARSLLPANWDHTISGLFLNNTSLYSYGPTLLTFVILLVWVFSSAWMDMRAVLVSLGVSEYEKKACNAVGVEWRRELPIDLIAYFAILAILGVTWYLSTFSMSPEEVLKAYQGAGNKAEDLKGMLNAMLNGYMIILGVLTLFGLVALTRRASLSQSMTIVPANPPQ